MLKIDRFLLTLKNKNQLIYILLIYLYLTNALDVYFSLPEKKIELGFITWPTIIQFRCLHRGLKIKWQEKINCIYCTYKTSY